jgi:hypothetical protein
MNNSLVLVTYLDPTAHPAWTDQPELLKPLVCEAVGFLTYEDDDKLVLAQVHDDQGLWACNFVIPRQCILNAAELERCVSS